VEQEGRQHCMNTLPHLALYPEGIRENQRF